MWNLIKSVFRSLKKNKVSMIGLTFLVFLSMGVFTILNSTATNIKNEYNQISTSGNLHDFTVSENYNIGNINWTYYEGTDHDYDGWSSDAGTNPNIPWPAQTWNGSDWTRTYQMKVDVPPNDTSTLINQFYHDHGTDEHQGDQYWDMLNPIYTITGAGELGYLTAGPDVADHKTDESLSDVLTEVKFSGDLTQLFKQETITAQTILNVISQTDTPIQEYLSDPTAGLGNDVTFRNFKSLGINNSPDDILYKVVQSNPEDKIDKIYSLDENKLNNFSIHDFNPLQNEVWSSQDWNFYNDLFVKPYGNTNKPRFADISDLIHYNLPYPYPTTDPEEEEAVHAFFILLSKGNLSDEVKNLTKDITSLSSQNPGDWSWASAYIDYHDNFHSNGQPVITDHHYKYSLNWTTTAAWTLQDWTADFVVAAPEYLNKHNITPWNLQDADGTKLSPADFKSKLNNMNEVERSTYITKLAVDNPNHSLRIGGEGAMPFIVIGSGITADFIYPILDIQHAVPNPDKECIIFGNDHTYDRVFDSYRGNPTENYLVGKFNDGVDPQKTIDAINAKAKEEMNWPKGIKAAYLANDTTDFLNAGAFRIAYIPQLVNRVQYISYALTTFIVILSLFICGIVIRRFVSNNRMQIGVMQANGIKKSQIAFSLTPFALIPAIIGGIGGYIAGLLLQSSAMGLFSNYWMLPTAFASFNILSFLVALLIPFAIFMVVAIISTLIVLREKTVDLMKQGSEYKSNAIARNIKKPFVNFGIMTKFRVSLAFNSFWKLIVLSIMSALAMSTLVFSITIVGKFDYVKDKTFASRNYTYAVDLTSPTNQGGQYIPVDAEQFGESGFINTSNGSNWVPNNYFDKEFTEGGAYPSLLPFADTTYSDIFKTETYDDYYGIPKLYHSLTYAAYDLAALLLGGKSGDVERSFSVTPSTPGSDDGHVYGTAFYPMLSDSTGESIDPLFMKNMSMDQSAMNYTVGIAGFMASNPWELAVSLMPENNKNLCDGRTIQLVQQLGEAVCGGSNADRNPHGYSIDWNTKYVDKDFFAENDTSASGDSRIDPDCAYNYSFIEDNCVMPLIGECLKPEFMSFLNDAYNSFEIYNGEKGLTNNDYAVVYNKVPLNTNDETYTYLSVTGSKQNKSYPSNLVAPSGTRVVGIKPDTKYVELVDNNNKDLKPLLADDKVNINTTNETFPIVVNEFAAYKYNLKVGDKISFNIDNKANLLDNIITDENYSPEKDPSTLGTFNVVGINTTYEGEEYFTNQQLANYLLGLKSNFSSGTIHNYYFDSTELPIISGDGSLSPPGSSGKRLDYIYDLNNGGEFPLTDKTQLRTLSLWNPAYDYVQNTTPPTNNITPYGFNGVFTNKSNGSAILNSGMYIYSKSGLYPGNDSLNSDLVKSMLKIGPNLQTASIIAGFYNPKTDEGTDLGKQINGLYSEWIKAPVGEEQSTHNAMVEDTIINEFIAATQKTFGQTVVNALVSGAIDKDSTETIFTNLSTTVEQIEDVTLAVISLMVTIIVILITIMLINDAKKLASILKALGYKDGENATSFLAIYLPVIILGLLIAIPLSFGIVIAFQSIIFSGTNILLTANIHWWSFLIGVGAIASILAVSGIGGYHSLKKDRLTDMIKE